MKYLLDTNAFISAKNGAFAFESCPGFWTWLAGKNKTDEVFSIDKVKKELLAEEDQLCNWIELHGEKLFLKTDNAETAKNLREISAWLWLDTQYTEAAKRTFLSCADYYIVGYAMSGGFTVVTMETDQPLATARIKIPTVCKHFGVRVIRLYEMTRALRMRLVMDGA